MTYLQVLQPGMATASAYAAGLAPVVAARPMQPVCQNRRSLTNVLGRLILLAIQTRQEEQVMTGLQDRIDRRIARFDDRREDWTVFGFETQKDPKFARAQRRYIGASGSVD